MSSAVGSLPDHDVVHVYSPRDADRPDRPAFPELSVVALREPVRTFEGELVAAGTIATVVYVHGEGAAYDIEFAEPCGIATVEGYQLRPA